MLTKYSNIQFRTNHNEYLLGPKKYKITTTKTKRRMRVPDDIVF